MNTKQIEYILELVKTKNFNRASENLFISQPTMTYQINSVEEEIGFRLFDRTGKGASLTPAGEQFIVTLQDINSQLKRAIDQGQNFCAEFRENIRIGMPIRSALYYLPEILEIYSNEVSSISITPYFDYHHSIDNFLKGEQDIVFAIKDSVKQVPDIRIHELYDSKIYLVCRRDDVLSQKQIINEEDLKGRTLMIGGNSPGPLRIVQQRIIRTIGVDYFNSNDHDMSLTYVSSKKAVVLAPGILNDHHPDFAWIPFNCVESIQCILCTHSNDNRESLLKLIDTICRYYKNKELKV